MSKVQDKERISEAAREEQLVNYKGTPIKHKTNCRFATNFVGKKGVAQYIERADRQELPTKNTVSGKVIIIRIKV